MYYTDPTNGQFVSEYAFPGDYPGEVRRDTEWFATESEALRFSRTGDPPECACVMDCRDCSLSGEWHVHPGDACAVHPDAPGDH